MREKVTFLAVIIMGIGCTEQVKDPKNIEADSEPKTEISIDTNSSKIEIEEKNELTAPEMKILDFTKIISFHISEDEIKNRNLIPVESSFKEKYIKGNRNFMKLDPSPPSSGVRLEHYYWGEMSLNNGTLKIIMEYFSIDNSEAKLHALMISETGELKSSFKVAEIINYPDGKYIENSKLNKNELTKIGVIDGLLEYIESTDKYVYHKDSTIRKYDIGGWENIQMVDSNFVQTTYTE